jgi:hypothetical protein
MALTGAGVAPEEKSCERIVPLDMLYATVARRNSVVRLATQPALENQAVLSRHSKAAEMAPGQWTIPLFVRLAAHA